MAESRVWHHGGECGLGCGLAQPERAGCHSAGRRWGKRAPLLPCMRLRSERESKFRLSDEARARPGS